MLQRTPLRPLLALPLLALGALAHPSRVAGAQVAPELQREHAARREALAALAGDGVVLVVGAEAPADTRGVYHQAREMLYLTGYREPGAALLLGVRGGAVREARLLVAPRDPVEELWNGRRLGVDGATRLTGIAAAPRPALGAVLDSLLGDGNTLLVASDTAPGTPASRQLAALRQARPGLVVRDVRAHVARLRARKSAHEIALLARAAELTTNGVGELLRATKPGMHEYELEALLAYSYRRNGGDGVGFPQIVASGPNALTLHYMANDRRLEAGDLVVLDVGASYQGYVSDYSRTVPVSGRFTDDQRTIYTIVRDAQAVAERNLRPGASFAMMADSAQRVLAAGLVRLGLVESPAATYDPAPGEWCAGRTAAGCPQWFLYYMHALGHGVGLDVHDPDQSQLPGAGGRLAEGSVMMLEVGIYVRPDVLTMLADTPRNRALRAHAAAAVRRYAGIAVRLEDEYAIAAGGEVRWLTRSPRELTEIEAAMRARGAASAPPPAPASGRRAPRE